MPGEIEHVAQGDRPSADRQNRIADALRQGDVASAGIVDVLGITTRPPHQRTKPVLRWGKLSGTLSAGSTAPVALWQASNGSWGGWDQDSGQSWTVYAPPILSSGSINSGKWVLVGIINGRKVVLLAEC